MKILPLGAVLAGMWLVVGSRPADTPSGRAAGAVYAAAAEPRIPVAPTAAPSVAPATLTEVVQRYCVVCHNDQLLTGNMSLQSFTVETAAERAETAERMIRKLRAGMMPPPGIPRPAGDTLVALVETLESTVDAAAARVAPNVGTRRFQRLSRPEYERVIEELLALEVDAGKWLPPDLLMGAFDNQSAAQPFSTTLLDSFLRAATEISRMALGNPGAASVTIKHAIPERVTQQAWDRLEGAPFGTRGGMVVTHDFPADGEYVFQVVKDQGTGNQTAVEDFDISIDGERIALLMLEHNGGEAISDFQTEPIFVRAGQHRVSAAFVKLIDGPYEDRFLPFGWSSAGGSAGWGVWNHRADASQRAVDNGPQECDWGVRDGKSPEDLHLSPDVPRGRASLR